MRRVVVSFRNISKDFSFPVDCLVEVVLREVAMEFEVDLPLTHLALADDLGNPLAPELTLDEEGVVEGEPLELIPFRRD
jgi:hypothetical protein